MSVRENVIRSVLLPLVDSSVLLPHSAMLDVLPERDIKQVDALPEWVLGEVNWNNYSIPLVAMDVAFGGVMVEKPRRSRIVIVTCLSKSIGYKYLAIRVTKVPRLVQFSEGALKQQDAGNLCSEYIRFYGELNHQLVIIPDMQKLEAHIEISNKSALQA